MEYAKSLRPPNPLLPQSRKGSLSGSTIDKVLTSDSESMASESKPKSHYAGRGGAPPQKKEKEKEKEEKEKGQRDSKPKFFKISSLRGPSHRLEPDDNASFIEEIIDNNINNNNSWTQKPNEAWSVKSMSSGEDSSTNSFFIDPIKLLEMDHGVEIVLKMITKENAVNVFFYKNCFGNEKIKKKCIKLITENFREIRETEDFQEAFREVGDRGGSGEVLLEIINAL